MTETDLYFMDTESSLNPTVAFYDFKSRTAKPVSQFDNQPNWTDPGLTASRDGRTIFYGQHDLSSTIMIVENLQ